WLLAAVRRPALIAFPHYLAGLELYATHHRIRLIAAGEGVQIAAVINWCHPMEFQRRAAPQFIETFSVRLHLQQERADPVIRGGNEHHVVYDQWRGSIHRLRYHRTEPACKIQLAGFRVERDQPLPHETEEVPLAVDRRRDGTGVAGLLVFHCPIHRWLAAP